MERGQKEEHDQAMNPSRLSKGDTVRATKCIYRYDGRCELGIGKTAVVQSIFEGDNYQIVSVKLPTGDKMIDIVVRNGIPLEKI